MLNKAELNSAFSPLIVSSTAWEEKAGCRGCRGCHNRSNHKWCHHGFELNKCPHCETYHQNYHVLHHTLLCKHGYETHVCPYCNQFHKMNVLYPPNNNGCPGHQHNHQYDQQHNHHHHHHRQTSPFGHSHSIKKIPQIYYIFEEPNVTGKHIQHGVTQNQQPLVYPNTNNIQNTYPNTQNIPLNTQPNTQSNTQNLEQNNLIPRVIYVETMNNKIEDSDNDNMETFEEINY